MISTFVKEMQILSDFLFEYDSDQNQFVNVLLCVDIYMPGFCKSFKTIITSVPVAKWPKMHSWKARGH